MELGRPIRHRDAHRCLLCIALSVVAVSCGDSDSTAASGQDTITLALVLEPNRAAFGLDETITVSGLLTDADGVTAAAALGPLSVTPDGNHALVGADGSALRFSAEGRYTISAAAAADTALTASATLVVDVTPPVITLTSPERAVVTDSLTQIDVAGTVTDLAGVASVHVNGVAAALSDVDGAFSQTVDLAYGLTAIDVVATDSRGAVSRVTRGVERSAAFYGMSAPSMASDGATDAIVASLLPAAIDDDDQDEAPLDDLASIFAVVLGSLDLVALMPSPLLEPVCDGGTCGVTVTGFTMAQSDVDLTLKPGLLGVSTTLNAPAATFVLLAPCAACQTDPTALTGSFTATGLSVETDVAIAVADGRLAASAANLVVSVEGLAVDLSDTTGMVPDAVSATKAAITSGVADALAPLLATIIEGQSQGILGSLMERLAVDRRFDLPGLVEGLAPNPIVISTAPTGIDITPAGLRIKLDGVAYTGAPMRPYPSLGSIDRTGCAPRAAAAFPPPSPITISLHDDFVNQLLFAVWEGGTLSLDLGPTETASLVADFGITDMTLKVEAHLPPVFNSCRGADDVVQLAELFIDATFDLLGQPVSIALWLHTEAPVSLQLGTSSFDDAAGVLVVGDLAELGAQVVRNVGLFEDNEQGLVTLLQQQILPLLLSNATKEAVFALPKLALGELVEGLPATLAVEIDPETFARDGGYLTVNGTLR